MKWCIFTGLFVFFTSAEAMTKADLVIVNKSERVLLLMKGGEEFARFDIAVGGNPVGHKQQEGDKKTPEGRYILDYKSSDSAFYLSVHISYPNETDKKNAEALGVQPGGFIMIHGQRNGFGWLGGLTQKTDWTDGCIAVTNSEMDQIWAAVDAGTPIEINP